MTNETEVCDLLAIEAERAGWKATREFRVKMREGDLRIPDLVCTKGSNALTLNVTIRYEVGSDTLQRAAAEKVAHLSPVQSRHPLPPAATSGILSRPLFVLSYYLHYCYSSCLVVIIDILCLDCLCLPWFHLPATDISATTSPPTPLWTSAFTSLTSLDLSPYHQLTEPHLAYSPLPPANTNPFSLINESLKPACIYFWVQNTNYCQCVVEKYGHYGPSRHKIPPPSSNLSGCLSTPAWESPLRSSVQTMRSNHQHHLAQWTSGSSFHSPLCSLCELSSTVITPVATPGLLPATSFPREPYMPIPEHYTGDQVACGQFLLQCSLVLALQPFTYPSDKSRIAFIMNLLAGKPQLATALWDSSSVPFYLGIKRRD